MIERLLRLPNSDSRNPKRSASNQILHASPRFHFSGVHLHCRSREQRGRADTWSGTEKDFFYTDANAAPEKESGNHDEKEIADTDTVADFFAKEKIFTHREGRGIADAIAQSFFEKETNTGSGRGIAKSKCLVASKEKTFADTFTYRFSASQEEGIAHSGAI